MYNVTVQVQRIIVETYECGVDAGDPEEALDIAYDHFTDGDLPLEKKLKVSEDVIDVEIMGIEHQRESVTAND